MNMEQLHIDDDYGYPQSAWDFYEEPYCCRYCNGYDLRGSEDEGPSYEVETSSGE